MKRYILLTFDLEEFDLPVEFGCPIPKEEQLMVTLEGMEVLKGLLKSRNIAATFFTTSFFAEKNSELLRGLASDHEIASHSKFHSVFGDDHPHESKKELERITGKKIYGFRMPFFKKHDLSEIRNAGFEYDSSVNPTFMPGRYNNLKAKRKYHFNTQSGIVELPVSVTPILRFPLGWLSFKNIPLPMFLFLCTLTLQKDSYLHLYFHPWEFADLEKYGIPWYTKTISGTAMLLRFEEMLTRLKDSGEFITVLSFLRGRELIK